MEARAAARAALMLAPPGAEHDVDGDGGSGFVGEVDDAAAFEEIEKATIGNIDGTFASLFVLVGGYDGRSAHM